MSFSIRAALLAGAVLVASAPALAETLTLDQAIARAEAATPALRAAEAGIAAARGGLRQADVRPNPFLTVDADNFAGTGPYNVLGRAEVAATYNQPIERGGKRDARVALARREITVAEASAQVARLEQAAAVERAFHGVGIADYALEIALSQQSIEQGMQREALRRVRGYKDPLFVETRAAARVAQAGIVVASARTRLATARAALAGFWGETGAGLVIDTGAFTAVPTGLQLAAADAALNEAAAQRAAAAVVVEQSRATQDFTIGGGARFLRETNDVAAVATLTIPLGRFDRNQGAIERARAERERIELTAETARLDRLRRVAALSADAEASRAQAEAIVAEVYPRTAKTMVQVREGYARGGFSFRDMQDAADAILRAQDDWLEAITRYRELQTELNRLTGRFAVAAPQETMP